MSRRFTTGCLVEVVNRFEALGAHVKLDCGYHLRPGDRVQVHGPDLRVPYGSSHTERRIATVERAGPLRAFWARYVGQWHLTELYEIGFDGDRP